MKTNLMLKSIVAGVALAAGVAGIAQADDYSSDPAPSAWSRTHPNGVSTRDLQADSSWQWAMRDQSPTTSQERAARDIAAWRAGHPSGLTQQQLQALSSWAPEWQPPSQPIYNPMTSANDVPSWHASHPHGLSEAQFEALSSEAPAWQARAPSIYGSGTGAS